MLDFQTAERAAFLGLSGSGKSNAAKAVVARELERSRRGVVAFDPNDEWSMLGRKSDQVKLGPLRQRVTWDEFVRDVRGFLCAERVSIAVVPSEDDGEAAEQCAEFVEFVKHAGDLLVVFEEVGGYAGPDACELTPAGKRAINKIATKGRHWGCPIVLVAQRAIHIPKTARAQLTQLESFVQDDPEDLEALAKRTKDKEFAEKVSRLPAGESMHWRSTLNTKEAKK